MELNEIEIVADSGPLSVEEAVVPVALSDIVLYSLYLRDDCGDDDDGDGDDELIDESLGKMAILLIIYCCKIH